MSATKAPGKIPPKPGKDTVYIDVDDEITGIIDKVDASKQKVVALVLPKRATMLQSIVNMRLLKRSADHASKSVVLITSEAAILPLAGAAGLHVAKNLQSKPEVPPSPHGGHPPEPEDLPLDTEPDEENAKLDYHRSIGELADRQPDEPEEAIALGDEEEAADEAPKKQKPARASKIKIPNFDRFRLLLFGGVGLLILLVIFIILATIILPKATITIQTSSTPVSANFNLTTSATAKALDESTGVIPAVSKTDVQAVTEQVQATGQQNNGQTATGEVTMTAQECGSVVQPADVPAGTGITAGGQTFITQSDTSFSPESVSNGCINFGASGPTDITAQAAGAKYNLPSGTAFAIDGRSDVSASGSTSGGTDNIITVVSQTDLNNALNMVTTQSKQTFTQTFENQLASAGLYVFVSTLKASDPAVTSTPGLGQQATTVSVNIQITYTLLAVARTDLATAMTDALNKQINVKEQRISNTNVLNGLDVLVQGQTAPTSATLAVSETTTAVPIINVASVKAQAVGQKAGVIQSDIGNLPGVQSVQVKLSPFWISKAPKASKITVVQQQVKSSGS